MSQKQQKDKIKSKVSAELFFGTEPINEKLLQLHGNADVESSGNKTHRKDTRTFFFTSVKATVILSIQKKKSNPTPKKKEVASNQQFLVRFFNGSQPIFLNG